MPQQDLPLYDFPCNLLFRDTLDPDVQEQVKRELETKAPPVEPQPPPPRFTGVHWEFWQAEEPFEDHIETPLEEKIRHELEWRYPTAAMARFQQALLMLALHGLDYTQHPERFPFPQPKGTKQVTAKPLAKPPPTPGKPSTAKPAVPSAKEKADEQARKWLRGER